MSKLFFSYSHKDKAFARKLRRHVLSIDSSHEVILDEYALSIGDPLKSSIARQIASCDYFLLLASDNSIRSPWVKFEINEARKGELLTGEKKIFVVRLDSLNTKRMPAHLRDYLICDFFTDESFCSDFYRLMRSIERRPVHFDAKVKVQHDPDETGYLFSIWIDCDVRFIKQIDFVEYRFDYQFDFENEYNEERIDGAVHKTTDRRRKFGVYDLWTSESIVVFVCIYLKSTRVIYLRRDIVFGTAAN